jgi:hypothetical protein
VANQISILSWNPRCLVCLDAGHWSRPIPDRVPRRRKGVAPAHDNGFLPRAEYVYMIQGPFNASPAPSWGISRDSMTRHHLPQPLFQTEPSSIRASRLRRPPALSVRIVALALWPHRNRTLKTGIMTRLAKFELVRPLAPRPNLGCLWPSCASPFGGVEAALEAPPTRCWKTR